MYDRVTQRNSKANVSLGKPLTTGCVWWAPAGTPVPADANGKLDPAYHCVGYISEDGVTNAVDTDTTDVNDMGGVKVLSEISSYGETYQFAMLELNEHSMGLRYGKDNVTVNADRSLTIRHAMPQGVPIIIVLEILLTGAKVKRIVIPDATITEYDDVQYSAGDAVMYGVTLSANPNDLIGGASSVEYVASIDTTGVTVASLAVSPATLTLRQGETGRATLTVNPPEAASVPVKAVSDHPDIADATVTAGTLAVTAKKAGIAVVTVSAGGVTATLTVTVTAPAPARNVYYGTNPSGTAATYTPDVVKAMTAKPVSGTAAGDYEYAPDATANNGDGTYDVFALPADYKAPSFQTGGFPAPFHKLATIDVDGVRTDVWISDNAFTDAHSIKVS